MISPEDMKKFADLSAEVNALTEKMIFHATKIAVALHENAELRAELEGVRQAHDVTCRMAGHVEKERDALKLQLSEERERCARIVEEFDRWIWPDRKSEAYREAGDWAGPETTKSLERLAAEIRKPIEKPKDKVGNPWAPNKDSPGKPVEKVEDCGSANHAIFYLGKNAYGCRNCKRQFV